jgi:hypothetical protein
MPVPFRRVNNEISSLHFVNESKELACIVWNCPLLYSGVRGNDSGFKSLAIGFQFSEIAHLHPCNRDHFVLKEKRIGVASPSTMYSPNLGFGHMPNY